MVGNLGYADDINLANTDKHSNVSDVIKLFVASEGVRLSANKRKIKYIVVGEGS